MNAELIREALERQAEHAPDPRAVVRALPVRKAQHARRQRRLHVAVLAAAVVMLVVGTPALLDLHRSSGEGTASSKQAAGSQRSIPLRYRPTWLPPGVHQALDGVNPSRTRRLYTRDRQSDPSDGRGQYLAISVYPGGGGSQVEEDPSDMRQILDPERVDINGAAATYHGTRGYQLLSWRVPADPATRIAILDKGLPGLDKATLVRIARSMVPDAGSRTVPLTVGWWPDGLSPDGAEVSSPAHGAIARLRAGAVSVTVQPEVVDWLRDGGDPLTVDGRPAMWFSDPTSGRPLHWLVVQIAPDRVLTVEANNSFSVGPLVGREEMIRIARSVTWDDSGPGWEGGPDARRPVPSSTSTGLPSDDPLTGEVLPS